MSYALAMSGSIGTDPSSVTDAQTALCQAINLAFQQLYDGAFSAGVPIASTNLDPFEPDLGAIVAVRAIAVRALDGQSLVVKLTSAVGGTDQALPVSDLLVVRAQNPGDQYTAIKIVGTGRIEYLIAGDLAD